MEIKKQIVGRDKPRSQNRVIKGSSFYRIPAVQSYKVGQGHSNVLMKALGIRLQCRKKAEIVQNKKQNRMNRYMKITILKIRALVKAGNQKEA